jgi:hypothetical protein
MNSIYKKILAGAVVIFLFFFWTACSNILDEQPRSIYEPGYFTTEKGIQGGITSLYAHLRYIYGQGYHHSANVAGTDEGTWGQNSDGNTKDIDFSGAGSITASSSRADVLWNASFPNINTANGIIENATEAGMDVALIAEARFFRAFDYFALVQNFGGVPLDLGSGELKFNTTPSRTSVRNTVPEVYTKGVFPDLLTAINDLPETGRVTGGVTKTVARLYLAKAYLTYGWWLENPNNIPTYPSSARTDPDGHDAAWYFQQAYTVATTAIDNPGPFGLQPTFYDANLASNARNKEMLLYADRTESSEYYNGSSLSYSTGESGSYFAGWLMQWNYTEIINKTADGSFKNSVQRESSQWGGRPWTAIAPPQELFIPTTLTATPTFADKTNDSRYDGTFVSVYRGNWEKGGVTDDILYNVLNDVAVPKNSAVLSFLPDETLASQITYPADKSDNNVGAGYIAGRGDYVVAPSGFSRIMFPGNWKLGPYRTDNGSGLGNPNGSNTIPFNIAKFSELYIIAAEAAVKGATGSRSARDLINVIRARAGKWKFSNAENVAKVEDHSAEMTAATPATIDIYYILAERTREFYGEAYRWCDLVRTQKWNELAGKYTICGITKGDHTPVVYDRTIKQEYYLRPIPQGQIDGLEMTDAEKAAYQNPGY